MMPCMRTTLTLDADAIRLIEAEVRRRSSSFKQVVNDAIRRGLSGGPKASRQGAKHQVFSSRLAEGLDTKGFNRLVDELEVEGRSKTLRHR